MGLHVVLDPLLDATADWQLMVSSRRKPTRAQYRAFCAANPDLRVELSAEGDLIMMAPAYSRSGSQNQELARQLGNWAIADGTGIAFDSSTGFDLPNGSNRSPDAAWVTRARLEALTEEERDEYLALCPDFVAEIRSKNDRLPPLEAKMQEFLANGARLGWLIDPLERRVAVYRPRKPVEVLEETAAVEADADVMPGFRLEMKRIWNPGF